LREKARGGSAIGTTGRGIGPAYEDKIERRGVRVRDLLDVDRLRRRVKDRLPAVLEELANVARAAKAEEPLLDAEAIVSEYAVLGSRLKEFVGDSSLFLAEQIRKGSRILFEGAQGTLLDIDHGTYPYVTSSNTVAGNAAVGSGIGPTAIDRVMGITKAYTTRVGGGPFPTELHEEIGERLRKVGDEFGATTGRPRRCGWLDTVVLRYAARVNGLWGLALTKMDVLSGLATLQLCTAYELDGKQVTELPGELEDLSRVKPIYEEMPGWDQSLAGARTLEDLPPAALRYVRRVEELVGVPVVCISVGAERGETILISNPFRT
jgi:adenylosuccinate synthase